MTLDDLYLHQSIIRFHIFGSRMLYFDVVPRHKFNFPHWIDVRSTWTKLSLNLSWHLDRESLESRSGWGHYQGHQKKLSIVNKKPILLQITMANRINIVLIKDRPRYEIFKQYNCSFPIHSNLIFPHWKIKKSFFVFLDNQ